jgi:hypothetical protein
LSTTMVAGPAQLSGFMPDDTLLNELREWFDAYDTVSAAVQVERMADMAVFPLNLVTDGSDGDAWCGQWNREQFVAAMGQAVDLGGRVEFDSARTALFVTASLAVVFTDSVMTVDGQASPQRLRYADILVKSQGRWAFQTMIQGGWADMLTAAS